MGQSSWYSAMSVEKPIQFGRIPFSVVSSGMLASLKPAATKIYMVIAAHANAQWQAKLGMRRIAELAGIELGSVSRSVRQLVDAGLLETGAARNGQAFVYRLLIPETSERSLEGERLGDMSVHPPVNGTKADRSLVSSSTVHQRVENRSPISEQNRGNINEQQQAASEDELGQALRIAGIGEPKLSELALMPGLTPALVRSKSLWCKERHKGTGVLIQELQTAAEQSAVYQQRTVEAVAVIRARVDELSDYSPEELARARAWLAEVGEQRVRSVANQMGWLRHQNRWVVEPTANDRVLVECCRWAYENSMADSKFIESLT